MFVSRGYDVICFFREEETDIMINVKRLTYSALLFALGYVLPYLTANIPEVGAMLCPMHIPVLLCGFLCGPIWGVAVGATLPIVRSLIVTMPPLYPAAVSMAFELAAYGLMSGLLYRMFPKKPRYIYASLLLSMLGGRIVWGAARYIMSVISTTEFGFATFFAGAVTTAIPGIIVQIILVPVLIFALEKAHLVPSGKQKTKLNTVGEVKE